MDTQSGPPWRTSKELNDFIHSGRDPHFLLLISHNMISGWKSMSSPEAYRFTDDPAAFSCCSLCLFKSVLCCTAGDGQWKRGTTTPYCEAIISWYHHVLHYINTSLFRPRLNISAHREALTSPWVFAVIAQTVPSHTSPLIGHGETMAADTSYRLPVISNSGFRLIGAGLHRRSLQTWAPFIVNPSSDGFKVQQKTQNRGIHQHHVSASDSCNLLDKQIEWASEG